MYPFLKPIEFMLRFFYTVECRIEDGEDLIPQ